MISWGEGWCHNKLALRFYYPNQEQVRVFRKQKPLFIGQYFSDGPYFSYPSVFKRGYPQCWFSQCSTAPPPLRICSLNAFCILRGIAHRAIVWSFNALVPIDNHLSYIINSITESFAHYTCNSQSPSTSRVWSHREIEGLLCYVKPCWSRRQTVMKRSNRHHRDPIIPSLTMRPKRSSRHHSSLIKLHRKQRPDQRLENHWLSDTWAIINPLWKLCWILECPYLVDTNFISAWSAYCRSRCSPKRSGSTNPETRLPIICWPFHGTGQRNNNRTWTHVEYGQ